MLLFWLCSSSSLVLVSGCSVSVWIFITFLNQTRHMEPDFFSHIKTAFTAAEPSSQLLPIGVVTAEWSITLDALPGATSIRTWTSCMVGVHTTSKQLGRHSTFCCGLCKLGLLFSCWVFCCFSWWVRLASLTFINCLHFNIFILNQPPNRKTVVINV